MRLKEHLRCGNMEKNIELETDSCRFLTFYNLINWLIFGAAQGALK